jgi:hypothetical protein
MNTNFISQSIYRKYIITSVIVWAGCFLIFLLVYMFVLVPQKERLATAKQKLAQRDNDYAKVVAAQTGAAKEKLDKEIAGLHAKVDPYVLLSDDTSRLNVDVSKMAAQLGIRGLSLKGGQTEQSQKTLPACKVLVEDTKFINFKGSFIQLARLINGLERHKPVIFVDKFSITRSSQGSPTENDASIVLAAYVCSPGGENSNVLVAGP